MDHISIGTEVDSANDMIALRMQVRGQKTLEQALRTKVTFEELSGAHTPSSNTHTEYHTTPHPKLVEQTLSCVRPAPSEPGRCEPVPLRGARAEA
jgi:hypothetical protein